MAVFKAFHALMPRPAQVAEVAAVPYDVVNTEEAANIITTGVRNLSFIVPPSKRYAYYAVRAMDRCGNESEPVFSSPIISTKKTEKQLISTKGGILNTRNIKADLLKITDLAGREIATHTNKGEISTKGLKKGIYMLKSIDKKNIERLEGLFVAE